MKNTTYNWIWKWHLIGGLVSLPVVLILAITGIIYLFKDQYEEPLHASIRRVEIGGEKLTYQEQWDRAKSSWDLSINAMIIPEKENQSTEFVSGKFSGKSSLFINPYTGEAAGKIVVRETDMHQVRKLHGELLSGTFGTKIVELVGSWLIVLIISGLFLFFPRRAKDWVKLFQIRLKGPRQVLFRDLHRVGGFWFSIVLLLILAGGMPWTDVWGNGFKWVQKQTNTGFPMTWQARGMKSFGKGKTIALDKVVDYARSLSLPGEITLSLPKSTTGVFSIHNTNHTQQSLQVAVHLDQFTGEPIASLEWKEVGLLMRARMWAMAFHQGQFGLWNWLLVLITAIGLITLSTAAVFSYLLRKKSNSWGIPPVNTSIGFGFYLFIGVMSLLLPLFGVSVVFIWLVERLRSRRVPNLPKQSISTS